MPTNEHISGLIIKQLEEELSSAERLELEQWMAQSDSHRQTVEQFLEEGRLVETVRDHWVQERIWSRLERLTAAQGKRPVRQLIRMRYTVAAACVVLLVGITWYLVKSGSQTKTPAVTVATRHDIPAPTTSRAVLTLNGGEKIYLDSMTKGTVATQGQVQVVKQANGQLAYTGEDRQVFYNTLFNPRGSQTVTVTLADGTTVWLNAASSITYPTAFTAPERKVTVSGECYMEVAKNASQPFKVDVDGQEEVEVLGTSFNIKAYKDEQDIKTTLIDGSVSIKSVVGVNTNNNKSSNKSVVVLRPSEQATLIVGDNTNKGKENEKQLSINKDVNLKAVLAWKNGRFAFEGAGIHDIMRSIARWYDVQIDYQGDIKEQHIHGGIPRSADVSKVLDMLEATGLVHFTIQDKKIIVMP